MSIHSSAMGITALLNGIAAEATQTQQHLQQTGMPFHMPELSVDLKVALTASYQGGQAVSRVQLINSKNSHRTASGIQTRFVAVDNQQVAVKPVIHQVSANGNALTVAVKLATLDGDLLPAMAQWPTIDVNLDRSLAVTVNDRALSSTTTIGNPLADADEQGVYHINITTADIDQNARFPLVFSVCGRREALLIQA